MGPLPKGSIPAWTVKSGARMAELRRDMNAVCRAELQTKDVQLVGRYDKDRSPMFLYMEFGSAEAANAFGLQGDQMVPPEFGRLLASLWGEKAFQTPFWSCNLLAECLAVADEKALKALMSHGQAHACPLPPPALPPPHSHRPSQERDRLQMARGLRRAGRIRITLLMLSINCTAQLMRREDPGKSRRQWTAFIPLPP